MKAVVTLASPIAASRLPGVSVRLRPMPRNQENQQKGKINFRKPFSALETFYAAGMIRRAANQRKTMSSACRKGFLLIGGTKKHGFRNRVAFALPCGLSGSPVAAA
ncbi:hypothetical protein RFM26_14540 [Mesorhizobium sp. VK23B]|uniref:Uncharacterized protein n=1 Tax=Mesorhizobium dulcispinae TaxID=3072316 RepID=A0ABU4XFH4_9HYPH|nr:MULTISPECIES: hypothetical protein [unclassified Mesorhizobium]MDX8466908.1 hypothetical protein [Mesorhizobium sp. VK23B]MDX8473531.1 hypothetical protein [Mesorhizobium sp. VK23A]